MSTALDTWYQRYLAAHDVSRRSCSAVVTAMPASAKRTMRPRSRVRDRSYGVAIGVTPLSTRAPATALQSSHVAGGVSPRSLNV